LVLLAQRLEASLSLPQLPSNTADSLASK
jgi:hypothetical protein